MHFIVISKQQEASRTIANMINEAKFPNTTAMHATCDLGEAVRRYKMRADAIITPGNSYGDMSGTFDLAVRDLLGKPVEALVQRTIVDYFCGELTVGNAISVPLGGVSESHAFKYLIYAPTMRVPKRLPSNSDAPYVSILAALQRVHQINADALMNGEAEPIRTVAMTAHGHGTGGMLPKDIARQTVMAIAQFSKRYFLGDAVNWANRDRIIHYGTTS